MDADFCYNLMNLIKGRRSVRLFNGQKIDKKDILSIIEAGVWAPTGCNNQELKFVILDKEEALNEVLQFKPFFRGVSTVVLIFCDMSLPMSYEMYCVNRKEKHLPDIDTGLAMANMVLYAKAKGVDSCVFNLSEYHFRRGEKKGLIKRLINRMKSVLNLQMLLENNFEFYLRNHLKIPKHLKIMCGIAFGFAAKYPNIETAKHGGNKIMRAEVGSYIHEITAAAE